MAALSMAPGPAIIEWPEWLFGRQSGVKLGVNEERAATRRHLPPLQPRKQRARGL